MKKKLFNLVIVAIAIVALLSCAKDETKKNEFNYPMEMLYGTWEGTAIRTENNGWIDITDPIYSKFNFTIKFREDNTYYGSGFFGNGGGTYEAKGNTIITYIDGEQYAKYTIKSLSNDKVEVTMRIDYEEIDLRAQKK